MECNYDALYLYLCACCAFWFLVFVFGWLCYITFLPAALASCPVHPKICGCVLRMRSVKWEQNFYKVSHNEINTVHDIYPIRQQRASICIVRIYNITIQHAFGWIYINQNNIIINKKYHCDSSEYSLTESLSILKFQNNITNEHSFIMQVYWAGILSYNINRTLHQVLATTITHYEINTHTWSENITPVINTSLPGYNIASTL